MKRFNRIVSCAVAAGLMAGAAVKAQGGVVIGDALYAPMDIKMVVSYTNDHGAFKKASLNNKDLLALSGNNGPGNKLAAGPANEIFVIHVGGGNADVVANLTQSDDAELNVTPYISNQKERRHGFETAEQGSFELYFYQYFEGLGAPVGVFKWYGNYQLSMRVSGDSQGHREFIRFHGENAIGETYKENVTVYPTYYYDYLPARGCVQFEGRGQFNTPLLN